MKSLLEIRASSAVPDPLHNKPQMGPYARDIQSTSALTHLFLLTSSFQELRASTQREICNLPYPLITWLENLCNLCWRLKVGTLRDWEWVEREYCQQCFWVCTITGTENVRVFLMVSPSPPKLLLCPPCPWNWGWVLPTWATSLDEPLWLKSIPQRFQD